MLDRPSACKPRWMTFGAPRAKALEALCPAASSIRELYLTLTGDFELHGGYYPSEPAGT